MDLSTIITFVTFFVTYAFGELSKKYGWVENKYVPVQNIIIGILAAVFYYSFIDNTSIKNAIIVVFGALSAAGVYDLTKVKKGE